MSTPDNMPIDLWDGACYDTRVSMLPRFCKRAESILHLIMDYGCDTLETLARLQKKKEI